MKFDLLLFDLDGTLYDQDCGYEENVHSNIFKFMTETKGGKFDQITSISEAKIVWQPIFQKYNLTKRGLLAEGYKFNTTEYDNYIRQGAKEFIKRDTDLRIFLESLPQRKVIFTNAPEQSANEILDLLGVKDLFETVLGSDFMGDNICKPERAAFEKVLNHLNISDCRKVCYFEDSFQNLEEGGILGFSTVFIASTTLESEGRSEEELFKFNAVMKAKVGLSLRGQLPDLWQ
mmetsp:Transcript_32066/g.36467  ORF Transcript_32066/g.36467 Transcript_32066/m.36467 type:complete len:232 (-) Transcript_32066:46-741(-)